MKKFIVPLMLTVLASTELLAAKFIWPSYIDNSNCLREARPGNYPECGQGQLPNDNQEWMDAGSNEFKTLWKDRGYLRWDDSDKSKPYYTSFTFTFTPRISNYSAGASTENIPLKSKSGDITYKLFGLNGSSFDLFYSGCWVKPIGYANIEPGQCIKTQSRTYFASIGLNELLAGTSKPVTLKLESVDNLAFYLHSIDVTFARKTVGGKVPTVRLRSYAKSKQQAEVRVVELPGIEMSYHLVDNRGGARSSYIPVVGAKDARLNDRKCSLITKTGITFEDLTLSNSMKGKVGNEIPVTLGLSCNGYFDGETPHGNGYVTNSGAYVDHTVTAVNLISNDQVQGLDSKNKIALKDSKGNKAENLYVDTANATCFKM